jgi:hypothetical protein
MSELLSSMRPIDWTLLITNLAVIVQGIAVIRMTRR